MPVEWMRSSDMRAADLVPIIYEIHASGAWTRNHHPQQGFLALCPPPDREPLRVIAVSLS